MTKSATWHVIAECSGKLINTDETNSSKHCSWPDHNLRLTYIHTAWNWHSDRFQIFVIIKKKMNSSAAYVRLQAGKAQDSKNDNKIGRITSNRKFYSRKEYNYECE